MELDGEGRLPVLHFGMTGMIQVSSTNGFLRTSAQNLRLDPRPGTDALSELIQEAFFAMAAQVLQIYLTPL
jgi:hypothetical protein